MQSSTNDFTKRLLRDCEGLATICLRCGPPIPPKSHEELCDSCYLEFARWVNGNMDSLKNRKKRVVPIRLEEAKK